MSATDHTLTDADRETLGERLMLATTCNHGSDYFGAGAVCETCWANVQRTGRIVESILAARLATAEAEKEALRAEVDEALRAQVAAAYALADQWEHAGGLDTPRAHAAQLRAALKDDQ